MWCYTVYVYVVFVCPPSISALSVFLHRQSPSSKVHCLPLTKMSAVAQARPTGPSFPEIWEEVRTPDAWSRFTPTALPSVAASSPFLRPGLFKDSFNSLSYAIFFLDSFIRCQSWLFHVTHNQKKVAYITSPQIERD